MEIIDLEFPGVKLIVPTYLYDERGYSTEAYSEKALLNCGIDTKFVVDYECSNTLRGTVRGIHFQENPHAQIKLVRVLKGELASFVVDLRADSPTYKKWTSVSLSDRNRRQLYLPSGYGYAYMTMRPDTVVLYKFSDFYEKSLSRAVRWNDPEIGIKWPEDVTAISDRDKNAPLLRALP